MISIVSLDNRLIESLAAHVLQNAVLTLLNVRKRKLVKLSDLTFHAISYYFLKNGSTCKYSVTLKI